MDPLDIPELHEIPAPEPLRENPVAVADYLLTSLLHRLPAMLHAEFQGSNVRWFLQDPSHQDICIHQSASIGEFRSVLARFGAHYMDGQLYGGHTRRNLTQNDCAYTCDIFMANQGRTGFWIRVYATRVSG